MSFPQCYYESSLLQRNLLMGFLAVRAARTVRPNNTGPATDPKVTSPSQWQELSNCIGDAPDSVRAQWGDYCGDSDSEWCLANGGIEKLAQLALQKSCGNCQEKVAVAIMWRKDHDVLPLDFMDLNTNHGVDHAFVVIGRTRGSLDYNPVTWGLDAIVCDPWHDGGKAFHAANLQTMLYRGYGSRRFTGTLKPHSAYRIE